MADEALTTPETPAAPAPAETEKKTNHLLETPADGPDPDQAEMDAALAEVAAEEKAKTDGTETPAAAAEPAAAAPGAAAPAAAPAAPETTMVPVAAVQEERTKRQNAEEEVRKRTATALYWKGVADGKYPDPKGTREAAPAPAPERAAEKAIKDKMSELADQVDAGTLTVKEYEAQRQELDEQLGQIREDRVMDRVKAAIPRASDDLYLQTLTKQLEDQNAGWLNNMPDDEIRRLRPFAEEHLREAGVNLAEIAGTPIGDYQLRNAIVEVAKEMGRDKKYGAASSAAPAAPGAPAVRPTAEQLKEKERLAALAPPAPVGTTAPANSWTADRIDAIDPLDLENMPLAELKRIGDQLDRNVAATRVPTTTRR